MNSEAIRYFRCDCGGRTFRMQAKGRWVLTPRHHCSDPDETFVMIDSRAIAATPSLASQVPNVRQVVVELRRALMKALFDPYRPEMHYMRGPGPKWHERHATMPSIPQWSTPDSQRRTLRL